jgi:hypothetical protein
MIASDTKQIAGFVFDLRGDEMIVICRNYHAALYRFQRQDGSVSPDMALSTASDEKYVSSAYTHDEDRSKHS